MNEVLLLSARTMFDRKQGLGETSQGASSWSWKFVERENAISLRKGRSEEMDVILVVVVVVVVRGNSALM